jgi:hypothetical protein
MRVQCAQCAMFVIAVKATNKTGALRSGANQTPQWWRTVVQEGLQVVQLEAK